MSQITYLIKRNILFIVFMFFLLYLILFTYKDYGVPWDEKIFFNTGKYYVVKLFNFLRIPTNLSTNGFEPTPYHLRGHGVFMDMTVVLAGLFFPRFNFEILHLLRALFALPIFFLLYWIVSKLLSKVYGLISIVFLLLFPRFYPEIYYNAVDIPTTLLFTICLGYYIYYVRTKQTILKSILFGLILGVTINQRLLLFYLPILNFVFLFFIQRKNLKQLAIQQLTIFVSTIFFLHLTHPYLLSHPITGLFDIISHAKQYPWNAAVLFDSQFYQAGVNPLPWYYLPKSMLITIPPFMIVLFVAGTLRFVYQTVHKKLVKIAAKTAITTFPTPGVGKIFVRLYILTTFSIPFLLVYILKPTLYDSWRQFLFLTIPMIIIAMFGLNFLFRLEIGNLSRVKSRDWKLKFVWKLIIGSLVIISLVNITREMFKLHPYEYLYYNSFVGGLKGAYGHYETDYWGLGYKEAVLWFNKHVNDPKKQYKIFVEGDPLSSSYYFKPNMQLTTDSLNTDYIITFTRWNFHLRHPGKTIYTVQRDDVPLIFIKQIK